jgi:multidrug resistance protein
MFKNKTLLVLMMIMLVNALSYGTIIPLLYPFASRFGIGPFGLSLLFASFSLAQLIATPIMGRLSDKYGRKPLLLISLGGTSLSLALFASAQGAVMLFVARILDGITGGNISVAQAVIADSTDGKERAQAFGLLGAAFGFGFLFGPALGGILSTISLSAPFWFASALALFGTIAGIFMLKETLREEKRQPAKQTFFNIKNILGALTNPLTGVVLVITFIFTTSLHAWIIGFQTFSNDILKLPARDIGLMFAAFGLISIIMQSIGIKIILDKFQDKSKVLVWSLVVTVITMLPLYFVHSFVPFFVLILLFGIVNSPVTPVVTTIISERTKAEDQGGILGINQSIMSFGQIVGPLIAGVIAAISVNLVFLVAAIIMALTLFSTKSLFSPVKTKIDL